MEEILQNTGGLEGNTGASGGGEPETLTTCVFFVGGTWRQSGWDLRAMLAFSFTEGAEIRCAHHRKGAAKAGRSLDLPPRQGRSTLKQTRRKEGGTAQRRESQQYRQQ